MTRTRRLAAAVAGLVLAVLAVPVPALAHEGEQHAAHDPVGPVALFLAGVAVLGASAYLDARGEVGRGFADAGVLLGVLAVLAAIPWYWL